VRWLVDECVGAAQVARLRAAGHDVVYMAEVAPVRSDTAVLDWAQTDGRLLLTEDKDFGELIVRRGGRVPGLVYLRVDPTLHELRARRVETAIALFGDNLFGRYTIIEAARFRSRRLLGSE
jgi:predicted nuclease of predicted toxin-antitoxin system